MTVSTISVTDMHCAVCAGKIRDALSPLTGIQATHINPVRRQVFVEHGAETDPLDIMREIESAGFTPTLAGLDDHDAVQKLLLKRLGIAGLAMMQVMMASTALYAGAIDGMADVYQRLFHYTSLVFCIPVVCYSATPFFTNAIGSLKQGVRNLSMDVPIALAIAIAFLTSLYTTVTGTGDVYYDSVVMFTFLLLGARYIDNRLQRRFDLTSHLLAALPATALKMQDGRFEQIPVSELAVDDRVWVPEGAQIPVDGVLHSGAAYIDEALLTGESDWVMKAQRDPVYAGTHNRGGAFGLQATHAFDRSRIADIAQLAERAELDRADIVQLTDRIAGIFVPAVLVLAGLTFAGWQFLDPARAMVAALTVLVVSCPCALSLATPAALTAAMTRLRQLGIVLTDSRALESAAVIDKVFIDKTGTLTTDEYRIESFELLDTSRTEEECLALASALQKFSSHPYAAAFEEHSAATGIREVKTVTGAGVEGRLGGESVRIGNASFAGSASIDDRAIYLGIAGNPAARFNLSDQVRPDALAAVTALKQADVEPMILSGDHPDRCRETASELGIEYRARQTPEAKLQAIRNEQNSGHRVLMLGDGINDVPVLAGADVSAAVVEASDLVKSKASVLFLNRKLEPLVALIRIARSTRRVTRQNLIWAALYNLLAIPVAALGFMPPWLAALGMASSSTLVMLNASRLLRAER